MKATDLEATQKMEMVILLFEGLKQQDDQACGPSKLDGGGERLSGGGGGDHPCRLDPSAMQPTQLQLLLQQQPHGRGAGVLTPQEHWRCCMRRLWRRP